MFSRITVVNKSEELIERLLSKLISEMDFFKAVIKIGFSDFFFFNSNKNIFLSARFSMLSKYAKLHWHP